MSMVRQQRLMAVYKGEELLATGTVDELAEHFNVNRNTVFHWATPTATKRNKGGKKKIAVLLESDRLHLRQHQTLISLADLYEEKGRPISPKEIGVALGLRDPSFTSPITRILYKFLDLGFVERSTNLAGQSFYLPTDKGKEYVEEHAEDLLEHTV